MREKRENQEREMFFENQSRGEQIITIRNDTN